MDSVIEEVSYVEVLQQHRIREAVVRREGGVARNTLTVTPMRPQAQTHGNEVVEDETREQLCSAMQPPKWKKTKKRVAQSPKEAGTAQKYMLTARARSQRMPNLLGSGEGRPAATCVRARL
eukprot:CAMPEP_0115669534 /NCGR_PEP_ID=MMETSP0272-20121206/51051_1 /TAXON_ID=71861 /ORGANISM="Scrippsiella trochoidea, Strain CCMP3099" /LENGTH=120 /DNA_ID=CAMNT_0003108207 /DNA_START=537 /DNA_END=896 /DNA_ORIENTATION=+